MRLINLLYLLKDNDWCAAWIHCPVVNRAITTGAWNTRANIASVSNCHNLLKIHITHKKVTIVSRYLILKINSVSDMDDLVFL